MSGNNAKAQFYKQPRYYDSFSCIGGSCPMSCCLVWRVDWKRDEVEKLKNAECSEHLRELIDNSFVQFKDDSEKFIVKMDSKQRCPFLTEDNFCSIQRELGAEYLSHTCTIYPRNSILMGNTVFKYCNLSCYRIMDILCSDSDCMVLENHIIKSKKMRVANMDKGVDILNHPELRYRQQLFDFFYEIISDDSHSVETSVILGSLAAQSISKLIEKGAYDKIPESIPILKKQLKNPEQIKKLENITQNYAIKLGFASEINRLVIRSDMVKLISEEDGGISVAKYTEGIRKFQEDFADRPFALRNIALNLLLECKMPFRDKEYSIFENYCYFAAAFAAIKFVAAAFYLSSNEHEFKVATAYISRVFAHNDLKVKQIMDIYKSFNCTSPAYIAIIVS
ncbi:MAG: hypothetical protein HDT25_05475 [Ruminococcus sp.]|nr:hypothetical protein [Ruminococcus sp.]